MRSLTEWQSQIEMVSVASIGLCERWQNELTNGANISGKVKHLLLVRDEIGTWPWSLSKIRIIETAMARLRVGHAGVNSHLHHFGMKDTQACICGDPETIEHFLLNCNAYAHNRTTLQNRLTSIGVNINLKNILGGGNFSLTKQMLIVDYVAEFLFDTNKIWVL